MDADNESPQGIRSRSWEQTLIVIAVIGACGIALALHDCVMRGGLAMGVKLLRAVHVWCWPDDTVRAIAYLDQSFYRPDQLLAGMAKANSLLSGPRALSFFTSGPVTTREPWQFYTYSSPFCVGLLLESLQRAGVVWCDAFRPILEIAMAPPQAVFSMPIVIMKAYLRRAALRTHAQADVNHAVLEVLHDFAQFIDNEAGQSNRLELRNGVVILVEPERSDVTYPDPDSVYVDTIIGSTTHNGTTQRVEVIFKADMTPMQHILNFHSSAHQCFISAYGAAHLYKSMATRRQSYFWSRNSQHQPSAPYWVADPGDHLADWKLFEPPLGSELWIEDESLNDFTPFYTYTNISPRLHQARVGAMRHIRWQVSGSETRFVSAETRRFRELIEVNRKKRLSTSKVDGCLAQARTLAIRHTVAFVKQQPYAFPDELSGL